MRRNLLFLERIMNKISILSIMLSFLSGIALAGETTTSEPAAIETPATTDTPAAETPADTSAISEEPAAIEDAADKPVVKKAKRTRRAAKRGDTKAAREATETLNQTAKNIDDEKVREAIEHKSDAEESLSDARVADADAKKDAHLHGHSSRYGAGMVADAKENVADAEKELSSATADVEANKAK